MGESIIRQLGILQKSSATMCKSIMDNSNNVEKLENRLDLFETDIQGMVKEQVQEQMVDAAEIVAETSRKQAMSSFRQSIYSSNLCLRVMLAMIVNIGFATKSRFSPFFNFMFDPSERNEEVYLVVHLGLLPWLKVMEPLFGNYQLPSNYLHLLKSSLILLEPELNKSQIFYKTARKLFPCQPFKSFVQDEKKVQVFKLSKITPFLKIAKEDKYSPFVTNAKSFRGALSLVNTTFVTSDMKNATNNRKVFKTVISSNNKQVNNLRPMVPMSRADILASYMVEKKSAPFFKYLSIAKHIGISAGNRFFTPAVMCGINTMRSLHGKNKIHNLRHISFGWNICDGKIGDFRENVYKSLCITDLKFKKLLTKYIRINNNEESDNESSGEESDNESSDEEETIKKQCPHHKKRILGTRTSPRQTKKVRYF
jgi:hypothetical protein